MVLLVGARYRRASDRAMDAGPVDEPVFVTHLGGDDVEPYLEVPAVITPVLASTDHWFEIWVPAEPRAPNRTWGAYDGLLEVGPGPDLTPPPALALTASEEGVGRCGPWTTQTFHATSGDVLYVELEVAEDEQFVAPLRYFAVVYDTWDGCLEQDAYPADPDVDYLVRARAVDRAGNTSEWTEPEIFAPRAGCATLPVGAGSWLLLALLIRRRR